MWEMTCCLTLKYYSYFYLRALPFLFLFLLAKKKEKKKKWQSLWTWPRFFRTTSGSQEFLTKINVCNVMIQHCTSKRKSFPVSQLFCSQLIHYTTYCKTYVVMSLPSKPKTNDSNEMGRHGCQKKSIHMDLQTRKTTPYPVFLFFCV